MVRFLSEEWVEAVVDVLNASDEVRRLEGVTFRLQQTVSGGPSGDISYWTIFDDGTVTAGTGETTDPDVVIAQDYETAVALARSELNAQAAFMQGKLKVTGNMGKLLQHQEAIAALGPAMSTIETDYGRAAPT